MRERLGCAELCNFEMGRAHGNLCERCGAVSPGRAPRCPSWSEQVKAGAEKVVTKNGESYVALIDAERLDYYHRLERERIHLLLIDDARRGLADIAAGPDPGCGCGLLPRCRRGGPARRRQARRAR
jgi:hypothetical protein